MPRSRTRLALTRLEARENPVTLPSGFAATTVATALSSPTAMEISPDASKLFVAEQGGTMEVWNLGTNTRLQADFFADTPRTVDSNGERGLLGIAFDPNYATNRYVYVYYTVPVGTTAVHNRVSRFTANAAGDKAVAGSETVLLELNALSSATNHNGGAIHFGTDGKLFVAVGDNATGANAQSKTTLFGKMLRMNADGTVPSDNPYVNDGTYAGNYKLIWANGLRNPFTFAVQPGTNRVFINDVGQNTWEEIDEGGAGRNYGWPGTEGDFTQSSFPTYTRPLLAYNHSSATTPAIYGNCIAGGAFYTPANFTFPADYANDYFFADVTRGWIERANVDTSTSPPTLTRQTFTTDANNVVDLKVTPGGDLVYLSRASNSVVRVSYTGSLAPYVVTPPASRTVSTGGSTTFTVEAGGGGTLTYQWQRDGTNIPGATASSYTLTNAAAADNNRQFRVVVTNTAGNVTSAAATLTVTPNQPPAPVITSPAAGTNWNAGQTIAYSGTATDPESGTLGGSAFTWQVDYFTGGVQRPFVPATSGSASGTFTIPTITPYLQTDVFYRIYLTATDPGGVSTTVTRDIQPNVASFTLQSSPSGIGVTLDGQPYTTPATVSSVVGLTRPLAAPARATVGGVAYAFVGWSQGGSASQTLTTPSTTTTYTATYQAVAPQAQPLQVTGGAQRSSVNAATVPFDAVITFPNGAAAAFDVRNTDTNAAVPFTVALDTATGRTLATLSFGGNLANGHYSVRALSNRIQDGAGRALDGDNSGAAGGDASLALNVFRADFSGDGAVDGTDLAIFATAFNSVIGDANFRSWLDLDGDGAVDGTDLAIFAQRFNTVL